MAHSCSSLTFSTKKGVMPREDTYELDGNTNRPVREGLFFFKKKYLKWEFLSPEHKNLEDCGVSQQLDLQELRHAADDVADFAVEHDHHLLLVAGALRLLGL